VISIPEYLWSQMLAEFAAERRQVEQVCYFDGILAGDGGVVTTMTLPRAKLEPGRFHVPPEAMSEAGKHLRAHKLRRLAQIHTHPTEWTGHSAWDDEWAYSQLPGAISIVLPKFGRGPLSFPDAGVHVRSQVGWKQLSPREVEQQLRVIPHVHDFRSKDEPARIEQARRRSWWSALAFWRR
jgi:hypothetical protein